METSTSLEKAEEEGLRDSNSEKTEMGTSTSHSTIHEALASATTDKEEGFHETQNQDDKQIKDHEKTLQLEKDSTQAQLTEQLITSQDELEEEDKNDSVNSVPMFPICELGGQQTDLSNAHFNIRVADVVVKQECGDKDFNNAESELNEG